ncbi:hypothetical protein GCM10011575_21570 [Microlunatus endophyticus]|uniref:Uncharacterized protein n=1 Tax=Microlunatus endophyticus TaxID=1716077 RepID=A0A917S9B6_9ACTN|nr:hypothetical protein [Microlunatus endophyticus]GGL62733.1 hypothetical protein GCM10011575_21570 [Microlunatus endophyticus]
MVTPQPAARPRPASGRRLATTGITWAICFAWWLVCFFSEWSQAGWTFFAISGAVTVVAVVIGTVLVVRNRSAVGVLAGALAAVATIAVVDFLAYEIGSNL